MRKEALPLPSLRGLPTTPWRRTHPRLLVSIPNLGERGQEQAEIAGVNTESKGDGRGLELAEIAGVDTGSEGDDAGDGGRPGTAAPTMASSAPGAPSSTAAPPAPAAAPPNSPKSRGAACEQYWTLEVDGDEGGKASVLPGRDMRSDLPCLGLIPGTRVLRAFRCEGSEDAVFAGTVTAAYLLDGGVRVDVAYDVPVVRCAAQSRTTYTRLPTAHSLHGTRRD